MKRSEFLLASAQLACGSCLALAFRPRAAAAGPATPVDEALQQAHDENAFMNNWLTDLFAAIGTAVDPAVQLMLMRACGRGCYQRHQFKQDIAAYRQNFRVERDGDNVHLFYGDHCYCPAAHHRPALPHDLHCECTRFTHETIFEAALGRHVPVEVVESIRRGGKTCHLVARLA